MDGTYSSDEDEMEEIRWVADSIRELVLPCYLES
jgi:hypothetical protein